MKVILLDLGRTLEDHDALLPGAMEMLTAISELRDEQGEPLGLGLLSDFDMPNDPAEIATIRQQYLDIVEGLGIRQFFEPVDRGITLSTEIGVFKPDVRIFRAALNKFAPGMPFSAALFVTENAAHIHAAQALGMQTAQYLGPHFAGPSVNPDQIANLLELVPIARAFLTAPPADIRVATAVARGALPEADSTSWGRLGDDVFVFGAPVALREASRRSAHVRELNDVVRDHLHVVVQKGRLFQKAYPKVPVLLDRGRFLVVELNPADAARTRHSDEPCFTVQPLRDRQTVFASHPLGTGRVAEVPWVRALVDGVVRAPFEADLTKLVSFPTRHSTSTSYQEAATWATEQLESWGYSVQRPMITVGVATSCNVIAERQGAGPAPRGFVLVTAHLDSVNHDAGGGPTVPAPGADDNGSGSAGLLQIARSLRNHPPGENLRFILFGGEEQGLFGSKQYVASLSAAERGEIRAVVNMDMIGCMNQNPPSVLIEGSPVSQGVIDGLLEAAATYTSLTVETSLQPFASDHVPFIEASLSAVLTIEGSDQVNPHDHTPHDVITNINYAIAIEIVRMNLAFVALKVGRV